MTPGDRSASTRPAIPASIAGSDSPDRPGSFALNSATTPAGVSAESRQGADTATEASRRGSVERIDGEHDTYPHRRWVTWRTYLDGVFLGNAVDEAEGWRWIDDMLKLEARNGS